MENNTTTLKEKFDTLFPNGLVMKNGCLGYTKENSVVLDFIDREIAVAHAEERQKIVLKGERNRLIMQLREEGRAAALQEAMAAVEALPDTAPDRESNEYDAGCRDMKVRVLAALAANQDQ